MTLRFDNFALFVRFKGIMYLLSHLDNLLVLVFVFNFIKEMRNFPFIMRYI